MKKFASWCTIIAIGLMLFFSNPLPTFASPPDFITTWTTTVPGESITIPTIGTGYLYEVSWGDDSTDGGVTGDISHVYALPGTYTVTIGNDFPRIYFADSGEHPQISSIEQWGDTNWTSMDHAFWGATNLVVNATDIPDLSGVTSTAYMFHGTTSLETIPNINSWDMSTITDMHDMFSISSFNDDISDWDVSSVTNMADMFYANESFNQNIGNWDTSSVTTLSNMFAAASYFNQDISGWDTSAVTDMATTFHYAIRFNQSLGNWNIANVTSMTDMFSNTNLSVENYDSILNAWALQTINTHVDFGAGTTEYCSSVGARHALVEFFSWTITDGGLSEPTCTFTEAPDLIYPLSSHLYTTLVPFTVSFELPERPMSNSISLTFSPSIGSPIVLFLRDAESNVENSFTFDLTGDFLSVIEIVSSVGTSIPPDTYTVTLSYQDELGNAVATDSVADVTIIDTPLPEGTLHFHLFTDDDGNGEQDSGEDDGFEDAIITLSDGGEGTDMALDENGDLDLSLVTGYYTITVTVPSGYSIKGGSREISVLIEEDTLTDAGSRGVYDRASFSGGSSHSSGGSSSSNNHSSSSTSRSSSRSTSSSRSQSDSNSNSNETTTSRALSLPVAQEPACLKGGTRLSFNDINNSNVDYLSALTFVNDKSHHLIHGYDNGRFGPQNPLTRFEALTIALRSNCISGGNNRVFTHQNVRFSDVPQDNSEQSLVIGEAFAKGIITGIGDKFYPNKPVTNAEMVKMLFTSSAYFNQGQPLTQLDITYPTGQNSVFAQYLEHAHRLNLLPSSFPLNSDMNRLSMAEVLKKYIEALNSVLIV